MKIKFMYNGIKIDGILYKARYSISELINYPKGTLSIYASNYDSINRHFPKIKNLNILNDSDSQTDYFETDRIKLLEDNEFYKEAYEGFVKQEIHKQKRLAKGLLKLNSNN